MNDFAVIGCGIVGLATAWHLRKMHPDARITIIEKESGPAQHQTGNNSGVIHSGIYYTPGSLKARNCIKGYNMLLEFCREYDIPFEICGKIIVATEDSEMPGLKKIYNNGIQNGLSRLAWLEPDAIREREPNIRGIKAVLVPQAGIIDYAQVAARLKALLSGSGVEFAFGQEVTAIEESEDEVIVVTPTSAFRTKRLITCGGLHADRLARMTGASPDCRIIPFRGEYYRFKPERKDLVNHLVYPVPDPAFPFLGVHFTRTIHGDIEAGPNAVLAFSREGYRLGQVSFQDVLGTIGYSGFRSLARRHFTKGMGELYRSLSKTAYMHRLRRMMPDLKNSDLERAGAGVRAQAVRKDGSLVDDFHFENSRRVLHVLNAPSPAATASLAIGESIVRKIALAPG